MSNESEGEERGGGEGKGSDVGMGRSFGSVKCLSVAVRRIRRGLNGAHP